MPSREQLEKLLAADPEDVFLNFGLAMELAKEEPIEPALRQFEKVIGLDADYAAAYYQKGRLLLGQHRKEEAREVLTAGVAAAQRAGDHHAETEMGELLKLAC
ncbi:MAG TPA: tetratricopeptide repeat protein [Phycisphaerae bacterium]|nr:tetratricopeptide repeat protein [Phycisphaerae bacterium]